MNPQGILLLKLNYHGFEGRESKLKRVKLNVIVNLKIKPSKRLKLW